MSQGKHRANRNWGATHGRHTLLAGAAVAVAATGALAVPAAADPGGVNWDAVGACESGGNVNASNGSDFGFLQFSPSTYRANGGVGSPLGASKEAQIAVANNIIAKQGMARGLANWPVCGAHAHDGGARAVTLAAPKHAAPPAPAIPLPKSVVPPRHAAPDIPADTPAPTYTGPTVDRTVEQGETLSSIAGDADWHQIWHLNRATCPDPNVVQPGQVLRVPTPPPAATPPVINVSTVSPLMIGRV